MMGDKTDVLLKLNAIMKQKVESDLAVIVLGLKLKIEQISICRRGINETSKSLYNGQAGGIMPSDIMAFDRWKIAQIRRIAKLESDLIPLKDMQGKLSTELKTLTVRRNILIAQGKKREKRLALEKESLADERNLEAWTHKSAAAQF